MQHDGDATQEAERTLREATMRNSGMEPASWWRLMAENHQSLWSAQIYLNAWLRTWRRHY